MSRCGAWVSNQEQRLNVIPYGALNTRVVGVSGRECKGEREESSGLTEANSNLRRKLREVSS